jgi:hypothetical protein
VIAGGRRRGRRGGGGRRATGSPSVGSGLIVADRCLDRPIYVGDHFREVRIGDDSESIQLVVEEISAYGKFLGQLHPVVTAELLLSGILGRPLANHAVLTGKSSE